MDGCAVAFVVALIRSETDRLNRMRRKNGSWGEGPWLLLGPFYVRKKIDSWNQYTSRESRKKRDENKAVYDES